MAVALLSGGVALVACGGKKDAPGPAASSATAAASTAAPKPAKPAPTAAPEASADAHAQKPEPRVDPVFAGLMKTEAVAVSLEKKVSLPSLGVEWSIPSAWVVDDYTSKPGAAKEDRKGCHPPTITPETPYFDVVAPVIDAHQKEEWNGQAFPVAGQKPNGGEDKWEWAPYVGFGLGATRLAVVGTHRVEHPAPEPGEAPSGPYTHVWIFFKQPKTNKVGQIMLTWKSGDGASQTILEAIAKSVTVP